MIFSAYFSIYLLRIIQKSSIVAIKTINSQQKKREDFTTGTLNAPPQMPNATHALNSIRKLTVSLAGAISSVVLIIHDSVILAAQRVRSWAIEY